MKTIHFVVGSKGGCGKTFLSYLLAQKIHDLESYDLDTENASFTAFKSFSVKNMIKIYNTENQEKLTSENLDINKMLLVDFSVRYIQEHTKTVGLVDTGSASSNALLINLIHHFSIADIVNSDVNVYLNFILGGGDVFAKSLITIENFNNYLTEMLDFPDEDIKNKVFSNTTIILWKNFYFGEFTSVIDNTTGEEHDFTKAIDTTFPLRSYFKSHILDLKPLRDPLYKIYLEKLLKDHSTFDQAKKSVKLVSEKIKIDRIKSHYMGQLDIFNEDGVIPNDDIPILDSNS